MVSLTLDFRRPSGPQAADNMASLSGDVTLELKQRGFSASTLSRIDIKRIAVGPLKSICQIPVCSGK